MNFYKSFIFHDSLGSLTLDHTIKIIKVIPNTGRKDMWQYRHDNLGNALRNSMVPLKNGSQMDRYQLLVEWV